MRVADLARNLGIDSADLMTILDQMGITVMSDASTLQPAQAAAVLDHPATAVARARAQSKTETPAPALQPRVSEPIPGVPSARPAERAEARTAERPAAPQPPPAPTPEESEWAAAVSRRPILLWGPPGSGKSTFLAGMMFRQVEEDDLDPYDWRIMSVGPRAGDYIRSVLQAYRSGGQPNATVVTDAPFRFKVRKYRKQRRVWGVLPRPEQIRLEADLVFIDPPGELFTVSKLRSRTGERLLELIANTAGILLLIDPTFSEPDDAAQAAGDSSEAERAQRQQTNRQRRYWSMLVENLSEVVDHLKQQPPEIRAATLDEENRLRIPTAICITKMDQHPAEAARPADFLRAQLGESAFAVIENSFSNYTVYACSALGNDLEVTPEGVRLKGNPKPWGVVDPIRWILEESMQRSRNQVLARFGW